MRFRGRWERSAGWGEVGIWKRLGFLIGKVLSKGEGLLTYSAWTQDPDHIPPILSQTYNHPRSLFPKCCCKNCWPTYSQSTGTNSFSKNCSRQQDFLFWVVWVTLWNRQSLLLMVFASLAVLQVFFCWVVLLQIKTLCRTDSKFMSNNDQWYRQLFPACKTSLNKNQKEEAL